MAYTSRVAIQSTHPATLVINRSDSRCGNCGKAALPNEFYHETVPGWNEPTVGCRFDFTTTGTEYTGTEQREAVIRLRPDLTFTGVGFFTNGQGWVIHREAMTR